MQRVSLAGQSVAAHVNELPRLGQAFDEAWQEIAGNYGDAMVVDCRNRLALAILRIADTGERDVARLKEAALQAMKRGESPLPFIRGPQRTHRHD